MALTTVYAGTLGDVNIGLSAAVGFLYPLGAQVDALLGLGLGPLEFDLAIQFNAALAAQATLTLQIGNPLAALQLAIAAMAQLQASLQAALSLPPITLSIGAELTASAALAASLAAKLGGLKLLIEAALAVKIPAVKLAADLALALSLGDVFIQTFDGDTLASTGSAISGSFGSGLNYGAAQILPGETVYGIILTTSVPAVYGGMQVLFMT